MRSPIGPVDLRPFLGPPRSQGSDPSCTGFAGAFMNECLRGIAANGPAPLQFSPQFLWRMERVAEGTGDESVGATGADTIQVLHELGVCTEQSFAYAEGQFTREPDPEDFAEALLYRIPYVAHVNHKDLDDVDAVLAAHQPLLLTISVFESLYDGVPANGEVDVQGTLGDELGGHEVLLVGKREDGRYIVWFGSWPGFGDGCAVYFTAEYFRDVCFDAYTGGL